MGSLSDILGQMPPQSDNLHWSILTLEAIGDLGDNKSPPELEKQIADCPDGLRITWNELCKLAKTFEQVVDILVIRCENVNDIRRYQSDEELHLSCKIVIECFDSSYWRVYSRYQEIIGRIEASFTRWGA